MNDRDDEIETLQGRVLGLRTENDALRTELAKLKAAPAAKALDRLAAAVDTHRESWRRYCEGGEVGPGLSSCVDIAESRMFEVLDEVAPKGGRKGPRPGLQLVGKDAAAEGTKSELREEKIQDLGTEIGDLRRKLEESERIAAARFDLIKRVFGKVPLEIRTKPAPGQQLDIGEVLPKDVERMAQELENAYVNVAAALALLDAPVGGDEVFEWKDLLDRVRGVAVMLGAVSGELERLRAAGVGVVVEGCSQCRVLEGQLQASHSHIDTLERDRHEEANELAEARAVLARAQVPSELLEQGKVRALSVPDRIRFMHVTFHKGMQQLDAAQKKLAEATSTAGKILGPDGKPVS